MEKNQARIHYLANLLGLVGVCFILLIAFYQQFVFHELPCPLCLLQRAAIVGMGIGLVFNLMIKFREAHYGLIILSAITGLMIALRQIFLHVSPHDNGFGEPFLGLHLYSWAALIFLSAIIVTSLLLLLDKWAGHIETNPVSRGLVLVFLLIVSVDTVSSFLECGVTGCPDNPTEYKLFKK